MTCLVSRWSSGATVFLADRRSTAESTSLIDTSELELLELIELLELLKVWGRFRVFRRAAGFWCSAATEFVEQLVERLEVWVWFL